MAEDTDPTGVATLIVMVLWLPNTPFHMQSDGPVPDWKDNEHIYLQLKDMVLRQIMLGALLEGEPVPSVRQVASQERINPLTVSRAYQMLVDEGLLEKRRGVGMFVCEGAKEQALKQERARFLKEEWPEVIERIALLGLTTDELLTNAAEESRQ